MFRSNSTVHCGRLGQQGSNLRPADSETAALPAELYPKIDQEGLEPPTVGFKGHRYYHLSYWSITAGVLPLDDRGRSL
jgi:hypothetical protein